ncbi:MAG: acyltransferase [Cellulosilyticum sp.]|nr:acyltransferase [Cellulosilyticum sp.]
MRKNYIDNIRIVCILLLFPYHTCRIFTEENFYIHVREVDLCDFFVGLLDPWFMPILFLLAGMSTYLSLTKRSNRQYIKERVTKLLIPCVCGVLLTVPIQTYYAEKYHNGYTGNYIEQLKLFFTKETDLTGYTGGFTPAHFWFLLVLFIVSLVALPGILKLRNIRQEQFGSLVNPIGLFMVFLPLNIVSIFELVGIPILRYLFLMLMGAVFCLNEKILDTIKKYRRYYLISMLLAIVYYLLEGFNIIPHLGIISDLIKEIRAWSTILTVLGYTMVYWNTSNRVMNYFKVSCFPIYEVHQTILIVVAYFIVRNSSLFGVQYLGILIMTFLLSILSYEMLRRFKITRWMFGIKP